MPGTSIAFDQNDYKFEISSETNQEHRFVVKATANPPETIKYTISSLTGGKII